MSKRKKREGPAEQALPAEEAVSILEGMTVAERVQAVRRDVDAGTRRFAQVNVFDLAHLLDVPQPERPAGWDFCTCAEILSLEQCHEEGRITDGEDLAAKLEEFVDEDRLEEIRTECASFDTGKRRDFSFLLPREREDLAEALAHEELQRLLENGIGRIATYCVSAGDVELWFHAEIEDDGVCLRLEGPYDGVDGPLAAENDEGFVCESW
ncbi:MAG: hypothetical protein KDC98_16335 [Planctomycetes bacterium]|nr:hypothetical protein [Planctomycetota bacterium]